MNYFVVACLRRAFADYTLGENFFRAVFKKIMLECEQDCTTPFMRCGEPYYIYIKFYCSCPFRLLKICYVCGCISTRNRCVGKKINR